MRQGVYVYWNFIFDLLNKLLILNEISKEIPELLRE